MLLSGPPGTGKTLLARAVAGEAERSVLLDCGLRVRRGDRRRGRLARARPVRSGQGGCARNRLHRRARRDRAVANIRGRRIQRRQRRARADAEPDPHRDGRLRLVDERDRDRRDQPAGRARPGAASAGPLRPPGRRAAARPRRTRGDPEGAHTRRAARARRRPRPDRRDDAGHGRRRSGEPRQRGRAARGPAQPRAVAEADFTDSLERIVLGRRAAGDDDRGGPPADCVPRGRPRDRGHAHRGSRPRAQGLDHPSRPGARRDVRGARDRPLQLPRARGSREDQGRSRGARGRGGRVRRDQHRRRIGHRAADRDRPPDGRPLGHEPGDRPDRGPSARRVGPVPARRQRGLCRTRRSSSTTRCAGSSRSRTSRSSRCSRRTGTSSTRSPARCSSTRRSTRRTRTRPPASRRSSERDGRARTSAAARSQIEP